MQARESPPSTTFNPVLLLQQFRAGDIGNGKTEKIEFDNNRNSNNISKDRANKSIEEREDIVNTSRGKSNTFNNSRGHDNIAKNPQFSNSIPVTPTNVSDPLGKWSPNSSFNNTSTYPITTSTNESGMIVLLQRQVAEKAAENTLINIYKLTKLLEEANRTISHLHEEKRALEHALTLHSLSVSPLPPSLPLPSHPSELSILRDRVAYLESALESALEAHSGDLGPDWNLGDLDLDSNPNPNPNPSPSPYPQPHHPYPYSHPPSPLSSGYHSFASSYSNPSELMETQHLQQQPYSQNGTQQHVKHVQQNGHPNIHKNGKDLDKRPPFTSAVSSHSSRFAKPSAGAKLQIPKAPPDASKPVIRIDLSSEMTKTQQPKVKKKPTVYNSRTLPMSISPVTIANITNT